MPGRNVFALVPTLVLAVAITAACTSAPSDQADSKETQADYVVCTEPAGSWTDLTGEDPSWRAQQSTVHWTDGARCAVRLDTVWHRFGEAHCGWEQTERISLGLPIGTPYTGPEAQPPGQDWEPFFFFNADGAFEPLAPGERLDAADVPASAVDTGLRGVAGRRLLIGQGSMVLYEVQGDEAKVFVRSSDDETSCS